MLSAPNSALDSFITECELIREILKHCSYNSCVLFDYDNTLAKPTNPFAADEMFESLLHFASIEMNKEEAHQLVVMICNALHYCTNMRPVEEEKTVKVLTILNDLKIPTLLVTARGYELHERTEHQLAEMKLNFSDIWPKNTLTFDVGNPNKLATYTNGKIYCNGNNKDICIKAFFNYINYQPKNITMVDDKVHHLNKVKSMLGEHYQCEFHGIHYRHLDKAVNDFKKNFNPHSAIPTLAEQVSCILTTQKEISSYALQAIDQYSVSVLKKGSMFYHRQGLRVEKVDYEPVSQNAADDAQIQQVSRPRRQH